MSDIRTLLAQERQARRIQHPCASYSKTGVLSCNVCSLNIKSEALWTGHLKSANHKKNAQKSQDPAPKSLKRKIESVEDVEEAAAQTDDRGFEVDNRKKPKSTTQLNGNHDSTSEAATTTEPIPAVPTTRLAKAVRFAIEKSEPASQEDPLINSTIPPVTPQPQAEDIDEDEWAAFERDVAPLAAPDYSAATISAAPFTAAQLKAETEAEQKKLRDVEGEEEKEEEGRRLEEEFDVMEEMEERVRRLREKREALRLAGVNKMDTGQDAVTKAHTEDVTSTSRTPTTTAASDEPEEGENEEEDDDDEDVDDWYS